MKKLVVFDIDGTLNETERYAYKAYTEAFAKYGITGVTKEMVRSIIGCTPKQIVEKFLSERSKEEIAQWLEDIEVYEGKYLQTEGRAFEGIEEVLRGLQNDGYLLGVCSNATEEHITMVLKTIGLYGYFDVFQWTISGWSKGKMLEHLIERVKPEKVCMVGDRRFDLEAARENKIPFIGCGYGYAPEEIAQADVVVKKPSALYGCIKKVLQGEE